MRRGEPLTDDLRSRERPHQPHLRRLAEGAPHRAPDLAGDAQRVRRYAAAPDHRNEHRLGFEFRPFVPSCRSLLAAAGAFVPAHELRELDDLTLVAVLAQY